MDINWTRLQVHIANAHFASCLFKNVKNFKYNATQCTTPLGRYKRAFSSDAIG